MGQRLTDLFEVAKGHDLDLLNLDQTEVNDPEAIAYVSRSSRGNGVLAHVKPLDGIAPAPAETLSLSVGGSVCATFIQPRPYYTAQNVRVLTPKAPMATTEKLWWALCIWHNRYRFSYGRHANRTFRDIELPTGAPPWVANTSMPDYSDLANAASGSPVPPIDEPSWQRFELDEIFEISRGRYVPAASKAPGGTPEVTSGATNNGVARYIDLPAEYPADVITVARNGSVGQAFLQPRPFFATDDVHVLRPRGACSRRALLFVCALIRRERYRFNYGRKWTLEGMRRAPIRLPVDAKGEPDWHWIQKFVDSLPFSESTPAGSGRGPVGCSNTET